GHFSLADLSFSFAPAGVAAHALAASGQPALAVSGAPAAGVNVALVAPPAAAQEDWMWPQEQAESPLLVAPTSIDATSPPFGCRGILGPAGPVQSSGAPAAPRWIVPPIALGPPFEVPRTVEDISGNEAIFQSPLFNEEFFPINPHWERWRDSPQYGQCVHN